MMNIIKMYFETEAGQTHPSKSIKTIARIIYWVWLIMGLVALVGSLFAIPNMGEGWLAAAVLSLPLCKLMGWLSSLGLRAIAVVVESHEWNLALDVDETSQEAPAAKAEAEELEAIFVDEEKAANKAKAVTDGWVCKSCGHTNPHHIGTCPQCGTTK